MGSSEFLTDIASTALSKTLDATAARQKAISNNIANVETPGYKRSYVSFEDELRNIISQQDKGQVRKALRDLSPVRQTDILSPSREDGNNVNIDAEIADLAKTSIKYKAIVTILEARGAMMKSAINGGK